MVRHLVNIICRLAPFIHRAYYSPELLEAVSAIAGIDLVPAFDYEVGHCNISFNEKKPTQAELEKMVKTEIARLSHGTGTASPLSA